MADAVDKAVALRSSSLFADLPAEAALPIARLASVVKLAPDEVLFSEGQVGDALYVVTDGMVRVIRGTTELAVLGVGECVGEMAVLDSEPRSATIVALEPTRLIRVDRHDVMDLLEDYPELVRALANVLVARLRDQMV